MILKNAMKILLVIDHLSSGGAQRQLALLAMGLAKRGHAVDCFVYHVHRFHSEELEAHGVRILEHPKRGKYSPATVFALRKVVRAGGYEGVLSFLTTPNVYAILALTAMANRPRLIVSERSSPANPNCGWRTRLVERCYRFADRVVVNSHHLRDYFEKRYPWSVGKILTIWNGVDLERFRDRPARRRSGALRLLAVGQVARFKNALCLVEALGIARDRYGIEVTVAWLARRYPDLTPQETQYKQELDERIAALGLQEHWAWQAERPDVENTLAECDGLVHGSTVEGLPNAVCEALACGRPVLASDTLDHPRLVQDGVTGLLFKPADPESLAEAIFQFAEYSDDGLSEMGRAAREFAERELAAECYVDKYENMFRELIGSRGGE